MRINKYVAQATGKSRRKVDGLIEHGLVRVNDALAQPGQDVSNNDKITLDGTEITANKIQTILVNKPVGYVCSRNGQGSKTIYDLLPKEYHHLKPVGRLDKDSSGLLLLTNDGNLAHRLTHPSFEKEKIYIVGFKPSLTAKDQQSIEKGIELEDGISKLDLQPEGNEWRVTMHEGRNRQIRRTFAALGYHVKTLHRVQFGDYVLNDLKTGSFEIIE